MKQTPQLCQRAVLRLQNRFGQYLFSGFLDLLAGYGYRPGRSILWYLVVIFGFALAYFAIGHLPFFPDAFVFSLTSFHGRGFFPGLGSENSLHNPLVVMAAFEAVIGLLIEISFYCHVHPAVFWEMIWEIKTQQLQHIWLFSRRYATLSSREEALHGFARHTDNQSGNCAGSGYQQWATAH